MWPLVRSEAEKLLGHSLHDSNRYTEIYLKAVWLYGDIVKDNPSHRPKKGNTDNTLTDGTKMQRQYARKFRRSIELEQPKCNQGDFLYLLRTH